MTGLFPFLFSICRKQPSRVLAITAGIVLLTGLAPVALAIVPTTTQLSIPVPSVAVGVPTLLVATVTDASSNPVLQGTVVFYDRERILGKAQIVSRAGGTFTQGTANFKTASFTPGGNSITAVFAGTKTDASSTSAAVTVTVTGKVPTSFTLAETPVDGLETLIATLQTYGEPKLTGSVDFMDLTADTSLGTLPLTDGLQTTNLLISSTPTFGEVGSPQGLGVGQIGGGVVAGDFNGDGFLDLATAIDDYVINILIGNGDGTFKPPVTYSLPEVFPTNIYTGDFNNDGKLDLAVVNLSYASLTGTVDILLETEMGHSSRRSPMDRFTGMLMPRSPILTTMATWTWW